MTSKLVVNTIESDTGISSVSFASSISMSSTSKFFFGAAGIDIGADTNINRPSAGVLGFNINGSQKVVITSNGRLGIGTNNPQQMIEVQDKSGGTLIGLSVGTQYGNASFGGYNNYPAIMNNASQPLIYCDTNNDRTVFFGDTVGFGTTCAFRVNGAERLRITSGGDVVIGHSAANAKLHIASGTSTAVGDATNPALQIGATTNYRFAIHTTNEQAIIANKNGDDGIAFHTKTANSGSFGEACRITSAGNLAFTSGNGIDFSATSDASGMTKELLDDYEEGSWTPTYDTSGSSGSITVSSYSLQYGKYVKIGKVVYVEGLLRANVTNNSNGTYDIGGLPFTVANTPNASGILHGKEQSSWTVAPHHFSCIVNTTRARARGGIDVGDNAYTNANTSGFNSGATNNNRIYIAGWYRVEG